MSKPSRTFIVLLFWTLAFFSLFRGIFFLFNHHFFNAGGWEIFWAFIRGIRFDLASACFILGIPFLLLHIPGSWKEKGPWSRIILAAPLALAWICFLIIFSDLHFYAQRGRRLSSEIFLLSNAGAEISGMLMAYKGTFLIFLISSALFTWGWIKLTQWTWKQKIQHFGTAQEAGILLLYTAILVIAFRGGLQAKPLRPSHAFISGSSSLGHLALNPLFTVFYAFKRGDSPALKYFPENEAVRAVQQLIDTPQTKFPLAQYPVLRMSNGHTRERKKNFPNVVILVMEGWTAKNIGVLGGTQTGVTPNFDRLAAEGLLFENFYAVGHQSTDGIAAVGCSLPTFERLRPIGGNVEQNNMKCLGSIFTEAGYSSLFLHGAKTGSMGLDAFSRIMGFKRYIGKENFSLNKNDYDKVWGIYDEVALSRLNEEFKKMKEPFLGFWFSLTSHSPYHLPSDQFRVTPKETPDREFLDSIFYSDYSLGKFFEQARNQPYFQNTIFVIVADHTSGSTLKSVRERFHIPCLIYSPGRIKPGRVKEVTGQLDLLPTLLSLTGMKTSHHSLGRSVLEPGVRAAYVDLGSHFGWYHDQYYLEANSEKPTALYQYLEDPWEHHNLLVESQAGKAQDLTKELYSFVQVSQTLMRDNRLFPPATITLK